MQNFNQKYWLTHVDVTKVPLVLANRAVGGLSILPRNLDFKAGGAILESLPRPQSCKSTQSVLSRQRIEHLWPLENRARNLQIGSSTTLPRSLQWVSSQSLQGCLSMSSKRDNYQTTTSDSGTSGQCLWRTSTLGRSRACMQLLCVFTRSWSLNTTRVITCRGNLMSQSTTTISRFDLAVACLFAFWVNFLLCFIVERSWLVTPKAV